jgi:hypothetical protein
VGWPEESGSEVAPWSKKTSRRPRACKEPLGNQKHLRCAQLLKRSLHKYDSSNVVGRTHTRIHTFRHTYPHTPTPPTHPPPTHTHIYTPKHTYTHLHTRTSAHTHLHTHALDTYTHTPHTYTTYPHANTHVIILNPRQIGQ